jgi:uncharacterized repeat protein (TIGR01451 family)
VHEAAHTSLDATHASAPAWLSSQTADGTFISTYARDNPNREDIAESFLPYLAVRYRSDRISQSIADTIWQTIPNRIAYFDNQSFNMFPAPKLNVSITPHPNPIQSQTKLITYTIVLQNSGNLTATQVMITNTIPAATNYVNGSASHGGGIAFPGQAVISGTLVLGTRVLTWPKTSLSPGATLARSFQVAVTTPITSGDELVNTLSVASAEGIRIEGLPIMAIVEPKLVYLPVILR